MDTYGLIGYPLTHSFSKNYFSEKFVNEQIKAQYINFELHSITQFSAILESNPTIRGFNVTIPYKEHIIPYLDDLDKAAKEIGAVNCIRVIDGKCIGYNTDFIGFKKVLETKFNSTINHALILGNGGASKAVQYALKQLAIPYQVLSRKGENTYNNTARSIFESSKLWIQTTPVGLYPHVDEALDLPYDCLSAKHILFDLIYNPPETRFLAYGKQYGAQIINGYEMLVFQAEEAWKIWNNIV
ncbi:MAG: shikimate dehydrogenase [Bacteroidota bacterium]